MTFLTSFEAVHYRGIDGLLLPRLSPANLVTGANGIGKTALLEAIWLFTGRYNPMLLWNANVQRSSATVLDPVGRLSRRGVLELRGMEDGSPRRLRSTFEKVADIVRPVATGEVAERNRMQLPVTGRIRTHLDDDVPEGRTDGLLTTPWGLVEHRSPVSPAMRPNCVIEGTKFQSETSGEYLQRYSDMVRKNRKEEFTNAIRLMLPGVSNVEILTDGMGASYLSAVTTDGLQLPLHDLGGGAVRLSRLLLSFSSRDGLTCIIRGGSCPCLGERILRSTHAIEHLDGSDRTIHPKCQAPARAGALRRVSHDRRPAAHPRARSHPEDDRARRRDRPPGDRRRRR